MPIHMAMLSMSIHMAILHACFGRANSARLSTSDTPPNCATALIAINERANASNPIALYKMVGGYDHNYVLRDAQEGQPQARVLAKDTGIAMSLYTSLPGLQFYTGSLETPEQLGSLCLEPQHFPDAPNKPQFPNAIARPGEPIEMVMRYAFSENK